MKNWIVIFYLLVLFSCENKEYMFKDIDDELLNSDLYILPLNLGENTDLLFNNAIKIEKDEIKRKIFENFNNPAECFDIPAYSIQLVRNGNVQLDFLLNSELNCAFTGHGSFAFDSLLLLGNVDYFKEVVAYKIIFDNARTAKLFKNILKNESVYFPYLGSESKFYWEDFEGIMTLKRPKILIPIGESKSPVEIIKNDLKSLGEMKVVEFVQDIDSDSVLIDIYTNSNLIIPENYSIESNFMAFNTIELSVVGISKVQIEHFVDSIQNFPLKIEEYRL